MKMFLCIAATLSVYLIGCEQQTCIEEEPAPECIDASDCSPLSRCHAATCDNGACGNAQLHAGDPGTCPAGEACDVNGECAPPNAARQGQEPRPAHPR